MQIPLRQTFGLPLGVLAMLASVHLGGGHLQDLLAPAPLLLVLAIALGSFGVVRGLAATGSLARAFVQAPADLAQRHALLIDVERLERATLLGAGFGALWGGSEAIGHFHSPGQIGPALAFALQSLVGGTLCCVLLWLPWRQHLLASPAALLPARRAWSRALLWSGCAALLAVATSGAVPGTPRVLLTGPTVLLMLAGVTLPSLLAAPRAILAGPASSTRSRWLADALLCGGGLALTSGVAHCFAVLDQPTLLAPGLAWTCATFAVPALAAGVVRLAGADAPADEPPFPTSSPHPAFAAIVFAALAGMVAFVVAVLQQGPSVG